MSKRKSVSEINPPEQRIKSPRRGTSSTPGLGPHPELNATELFQKVSNGQGIIFYSGSKDPTARALSNFAPVSPPFVVGVRSYPTVEHYYQSEKVRILGLDAYAEIIRLKPASACVEVKNSLPERLGKALKEKEKVAPKALSQKEKADIINEFLSAEHNLHFSRKSTLVALMRRGLEAKFSSPQMKEVLLATGSRPLAEKRGRSDEGGWQLQADGSPGLLGQLLTEVRGKLRGVKEGSGEKKEDHEEKEELSGAVMRNDEHVFSSKK